MVVAAAQAARALELPFVEQQHTRAALARGDGRTASRPPAPSTRTSVSIVVGASARRCEDSISLAPGRHDTRAQPGLRPPVQKYRLLSLSPATSEPQRSRRASEGRNAHASAITGTCRAASAQDHEHSHRLWPTGHCPLRAARCAVPAPHRDGRMEGRDRIPTLDQLVSEMGVARATIRQALGELQAEGLLQRYRAKGTFVTRRPSAACAVQFATDWASLLSAHQDDAIEVLAAAKVARPPFSIEAPRQYAPGYQYLRRLHRRDAVPYLLGHVYLDSRIFRRLRRSAWPRRRC